MLKPIIQGSVAWQDLYEQGYIVVKKDEYEQHWPHPQGWRPIETAPRDKVILICANELGMLVFGQRIAVAKFHTEHDLERGKVLDFVTDDEGVRIKGRRHVRFATHWMPLPEPPK
jgi:hypothetical protein